MVYTKNTFIGYYKSYRIVAYVSTKTNFMSAWSFLILILTFCRQRRKVRQSRMLHRQQMLQSCSLLLVLQISQVVLSQILQKCRSPLYNLLSKGVLWKWKKTEQDAFQNIKALLSSGFVLQNYGPKNELVVHCGASPFRVGAALLQPGLICAFNYNLWLMGLER